MSKVTSKLQVTVPKALARQYGIEPGDEIEFQAAGEAIRVVMARAAGRPPDTAEQLRRFDEATRRQRLRQSGPRGPRSKSRGWKREELYVRDRSR